MAERVQTMLACEQAFSAHAAHELRSPLTSLSLRLEMLQTYQPAQGDMTVHYLAQTARQRHQVHARGGHTTLTAGNSDDGVSITVTDTSIGIPAEALPYIFERFYRVDKARSRKQGGAGLRLALVHSIVTAHGGMLQVTSQPGQGTTFTLRLARRACPPV